MKTIASVIIIFLTTSLGATSPIEYDSDYAEPGYPIGQNISSYAAQSTDCSGKFGAECLNDCQTLMLCAGDSEALYSQNCGNMNPAKPFCVDSICTDALPDPSCSVLNNLYQCTSSGIFPDPNDCTRYYSCSAPKGKALSFQCDRKKKLVFSAERKLCVPAVRTSSSRTHCQVVKCAHHMNEFILYPGNPAYYAYCTPSATLMLKCLDDENQIFETKTNKCTFNCKSAGYFPDRTSCTDYFICERESGHLVATKESCPPNYKFNDSKCMYAPKCTPEITSFSQ